MTKGNNSRGAWLRNIVHGHVEMPDGLSIKFLAFLVMLILIYITNNHDAEKQAKRISELTHQVKELQYEQISTQSDLMNMSKQSEVLRRVRAENLELEELTEPPRIKK